MAFCFLEDLQREFLSTCDYKKVLEAKRAYAFIEFGMYIVDAQKCFTFNSVHVDYI